VWNYRTVLVILALAYRCLYAAYVVESAAFDLWCLTDFYAELLCNLSFSFCLCFLLCIFLSSVCATISFWWIKFHINAKKSVIKKSTLAYHLFYSSPVLSQILSVSEMTCIVWGGALNSIHSLPQIPMSCPPFWTFRILFSPPFSVSLACSNVSENNSLPTSPPLNTQWQLPLMHFTV